MEYGYEHPEWFERLGRPTLSPPERWTILSQDYDYRAEFREIAEFIAEWQVVDTTSPDYGGIIEAEAGPLSGVVQTDNTLEAIWVWARYARVFGDLERFREAIDRAWGYCINYPAWEEEGLPQQYYRVHNCGWGLLAEMEYREVYNDTSRHWYSDTCASYILTHPLNLYDPSPVWSRINPFVTGLAAGCLYRYGVKEEYQECVDTALIYGERLIEWVEQDPEQNLTDEMWALSSGTVMWGICNSVFKEDRERGIEWIDEYGPMLDTFQVWYNRVYDYFDWDNAWNVAYAHGHYAMYEISGDTTYRDHHKFLTHLLLSYDTDEDGGIPATTQDPVTEDMTWISSYLALKGVDKLLGPPDAGVAKFISPDEGARLKIGDWVPISAEVQNFGYRYMRDIAVVLPGWDDRIGEGAIINLDAGEIDTIHFFPWVPTRADTYTLVSYTAFSYDTNFTNDTARVTVVVEPASVEESPIIAGFRIEPPLNPVRGELSISCTLREVEVVQLSIYDLGGRRLKALSYRPNLPGSHKIRWDLRDERGKRLPAGVYFYILEVGDFRSRGKVVVLR